ncbi:MAG: shikimate dehydrogenase [Acidimicrobiales bacterium]|nr:shikimate dehydrogenase [Acidimicrobiales bacterium]
MGSPRRIGATTQLAAVIGHPVRHSLSPVLHNAAFDALGLDWVYLALEVAPDRGEAAVRAVAALGLRGLSVTMPHKDAAAAAVDELSPVAATLGAVNCVVNRDGVLVGENTDGDGLVASLRTDHGIDPHGMRCVVIGAGGAARSVILALAEAGASEVGVVNRTHARGLQAAALAGGAGRVVAADAVAAADLVVNATPIGMVSGSPEAPAIPLDPTLLGPGQVVADLVVHPLRTRLLDEAERRGAMAVPGLGMLVHQAGLAFSLWTGHPAPIEAMWQAVKPG